MIGSVFTYQRLSKDFLLIYQNLGADFCVPKSGCRSQKHSVLLPGKRLPKMELRLCDSMNGQSLLSFVSVWFNSHIDSRSQKLKT